MGKEVEIEKKKSPDSDRLSPSKFQEGPRRPELAHDVICR